MIIIIAFFGVWNQMFNHVDYAGNSLHVVEVGAAGHVADLQTEDYHGDETQHAHPKYGQVLTDCLLVITPSAN